MSGEKLIPVKFVERCANYNKGEIAGFIQSQVDELVKRKIAVVVNVPSQGKKGE